MSRDYTIEFHPSRGIFHCYTVVDRYGRIIDSFGTYYRAEEAIKALEYAQKIQALAEAAEAGR